MYRQFNIQHFYVLPHTVYLCDLCGYQNKQRLFPYTTLTGFYNRVLTLYRPVVTIYTASLTFNNGTLCPHCIYVFCIYLRTNSDLCHLQHKLVGFYNREGLCLLRGTDWVFKCNSLNFRL